MIRDFSNAPPDLDGRGILVTGGTGSFGKAFIKRVLETWKPARLVVFSRDEFKQYEMEQALNASRPPNLRFFIGDVRDSERLAMAMRGIDVVVHAAALKHVPAAEYNPFECISTNVYGAENVVRAAMRANVRQVIALSTDKAVNPVNLYGASKLAAEKIFVAANSLSAGHGPVFSVVRYGNVLGSRGSVLPLFRRLIAEGVTELPITDERMTRFWITMRQGIDFVLSSLRRMKGGEVFVPKIPSLKIVDLARWLAPGTRHKVIGIRPGEKIHEVLLTEDDAPYVYEFDDCYIITPRFQYWDSAATKLPGSRLVETGFRYASNSNAEWVDEKVLREMLKEADL